MSKSKGFVWDLENIDNTIQGAKKVHSDPLKHRVIQDLYFSKGVGTSRIKRLLKLIWW